MLWFNKTKGAWGWRKRVNEGLMICSPSQLRIIWRRNQGGWTSRACYAEEKNKLYWNLEGEAKVKGDRLKALGVGENLIFQGILKK
jgi:hypothetical protein